ncbi:hypothetical protein JAAARDRAFT_478420 [Jaapia argillacea MUCL 33604]|uniref:Uncharacterized protein n=1 Tax=Jaapia argillacea MUCL 33604 TaxID=933084 RepID=A0A067PCQ1_9AGAM|nr:hypothetical protein JAAARDRAFT_478420 [Jaapia argillacea MUCL 33604]
MCQSRVEEMRQDGRLTVTMAEMIVMMTLAMAEMMALMAPPIAENIEPCKRRRRQRHSDRSMRAVMPTMFVLFWEGRKGLETVFVAGELFVSGIGEALEIICFGVRRRSYIQLCTQAMTTWRIKGRARTKVCRGELRFRDAPTQARWAV